MKLRGVSLVGPNVIDIVIPRGNNDPIVFKAQAIISYEEFSKLCKEPEIRYKTTPTKGRVIDSDDKFYKSELQSYGKKKMAFLVLKSLEATPDLVWEKVKWEDPETWPLYEEELKEFGLSVREIDIVVEKVFEANALSDEKLEQARQRFLASQAASV